MIAKNVAVGLILPGDLEHDLGTYAPVEAQALLDLLRRADGVTYFAPAHKHFGADERGIISVKGKVHEVEIWVDANDDEVVSLVVRIDHESDQG